MSPSPTHATAGTGRCVVRTRRGHDVERQIPTSTGSIEDENQPEGDETEPEAE